MLIKQQSLDTLHTPGSDTFVNWYSLLLPVKENFE